MPTINCALCKHPVKMPKARYEKMLASSKKPLCSQCRRYATTAAEGDIEVSNDGDTSMVLRGKPGTPIASRKLKRVVNETRDEDANEADAWRELVGAPPADPTQHWQDASVFDYEGFADDLTSLVLHWWRLAMTPGPRATEKNLRRACCISPTCYES